MKVIAQSGVIVNLDAMEAMVVDGDELAVFMPSGTRYVLGKYPDGEVERARLDVIDALSVGKNVFTAPKAGYSRVQRYPSGE